MAADADMSASTGGAKAPGEPGRTLVVWGGRLVFLASGLAFWEIGVRQRWLPRVSFGTPLTVLEQLADWLTTAETAYHALVTLTEAASGFLVGTGLALALACLYIFAPIVDRAITPVLSVLNAIPRMALGPLYIVWFGFDLMPKVVLVATVVFFIVIFNLQRGLHTLSRGVQSNLQVLGASRLELLGHFYMPALFGWLAAGIRTSIGFAFAAAIVGEYIGANAGLGYLIAFGLARYRPEETFAGILIVLALVLLLDFALRLVEKRFWYWDIHRETVD